MKQFVLIAISFLLFPSLSFTQDEEEGPCSKPSNKKVIKLLQQAQDPKNDRKKQFAYVKEALALDENCTECMLELARRAYEVADAGGNTFDNAKGYYIDVINSCPTYSADAYFYLGLMNYNEKNDEKALDYFNQFLKFKSDNDWAYPSDYNKKVATVKSVLDFLEFNVNFFNKPVPFDPVLVQNVSSTYDEYLPMISPDNELIFYTRKYDKKNLGDITSNVVEEITLSSRENYDAEFDGGKALPKPFNVGSNYGGVTISVDNKEMYICACDMIKTASGQPYNNCDIYVSHYELIYNEKMKRQEYIWSELVNLGEKINGTETWESQPSLSGDGKTLYFAKVSKVTQKEDIWYSVRDDEGNWTQAKPLREVNSKGGDKAPYMHSDSKTLYFVSEVNASEGRYGAGRYDIFYTRQDSTGKWMKPKNIGYPINTEADEYGLVVSADGHWAYITSGRQKEKSGGLDIYRFELPYEARPEKVIIVKGEVKDDNNEVVTEATVEITNSSTNEKIEVKVNKDDGKYAAVVTVKENDDVVIAVKKPEHMVETKLVTVTQGSKPVVKETLKVKEIKVNEPYVINDILFATASFELTKHSKAVLDQFVKFLQDNPLFTAAIHGHTDDEGNDEKNMILSDNRASAVKEYLVSKGIASTRLASKGYGETKPKVKNDTDENRALNRRTEFIITGK